MQLINASAYSAYELGEDEFDDFVTAILELHAQAIKGKPALNVDVPEAQGIVSSILSSVMCPYFGSMKYDCLVRQVAVLTIFVAKDHPFADGNKRTAALIPQTLFSYLMPGFLNISASDEDMFEAITGIATGDITEDEFYMWLIERIYTL